MINKYRFLLIIFMLTYGCSRGKENNVASHSEICCIDSLEYDFLEDLLVPASIKIRLLNTNTLNRESVRAVIFPQIEIEDRSFYELWAKEVEAANTLTLIVNTNYFFDRGLSKDSIEHLLLKKIGLVTSNSDTIYVEQCQRKQ